MIHTEFNFNTSDGVILFAQQWLPSEDKRASIILVHGLGEHSSRYAHVASALNQSGFVVTALDLRGHGKSQGKRGHIPSYAKAAEDIKLLLEQTSKQFPALPQFLYGHSLGGALVLYTSLYHHPDIKGTIATSPALNPGAIQPAKLIAARILSHLVPSYTMKNGLDLTNLCHDQTVIQAYIDDPLVHSWISARLGYELISNGTKISSTSGVFPFPLLLLQGAQDHLVDPVTNQNFANHLTNSTTFKMFENGYHERHNEPWKHEVFTIVIEWFNYQLSRLK